MSPSKEIHWEHSRLLYGVEGRDIHEWMDAPVVIFSTKHRNFRHEATQQIPLKFIYEYGEETARNIMIDHLLLDSKGTMIIEEIPLNKADARIQKFMMKPFQYEKIESPYQPIEPDEIVDDVEESPEEEELV